MAHRSKRMKKIDELVDLNKVYKLEEAVEVLKKCPAVKFDQSIQRNLISKSAVLYLCRMAQGKKLSSSSSRKAIKPKKLLKLAQIWLEPMTFLRKSRADGQIFLL